MFIFWVAFCVHVSFFVVFLSIHNMNLCHGGCFAFLRVFVCFAVTYVWPLCWHLTWYLLKDLPMCFSIQQGQSKAPLGLFHVCSPADICCFPSGVMDVPRLHVLLWFFSENILHCSFFFSQMNVEESAPFWVCRHLYVVLFYLIQTKSLFTH